MLGIPTYEWQDIADSKTEVYAGDADLAAGKTLDEGASEKNDDTTIAGKNKTRYRYVTLDDDGNEVKAKGHATQSGVTYANDANYIIFRDIDLSSANWSPLMFSGTMLGAVSADTTTAKTLWNTIGTDGATVNAGTAKPVISHVTVEQSGKRLDVSKQQGIGFFASITSRTVMNNDSLGSAGTVAVANLRLSDVSVTNKASEAYVPPTLLGTLTGAVGLLLNGLVDALEVLAKLIGINVELNLHLDQLLKLHKDNPSNLATGAFAGRIYGDVKVSDCDVADVAVSSVSDMTGGFVGYVQGATRYDPVSGLVSALTNLLSKILGIIPFLGLGDLVDWLLDGTLGLTTLYAVGYYNPVISGSSVTGFKKNVVIGSSDQDYAGGFVGDQIGAVIENATVSSDNAYTVKARYYAGGFSGLTRNDVMKGALKSLGVNLPEIPIVQPQGLVEGTTLKSAVTVEAGSYAGGFTGAMANSFAVNDTLNGTVKVTALGIAQTDDNNGTTKKVKGYAGGFTGAATLGWSSDLGAGDASDTNLLKSLEQVLVDVLKGGGENATALLSLVGVDPSAILGVAMSGTITVRSDNDYAGGIVGRGDGALIAASDTQHLNEFSYWKHGRTAPAARDNTVDGLKSVTAGGDYAGGIAGQLGTASVGGVINGTVGLGGFLPFEVSALTVNGGRNGLTVTAGGAYASAGIGKATGGDIGKATTAYEVKDSTGKVTSNPVPDTAGVTVNGVAAVKADNYAGGFIGAAGPGDLVNGDSLNLLGLGVLKLSGLLSVAEGVMVDAQTVTVNGITTGMTVTATHGHAADSVKQVVAGGFVGQSNSTQVTDAHVTNLLTVTADDVNGNAGGFVGVSTTGGLADVADDTSIKNLLTGGNGSVIEVDQLVTAIKYLIPKYVNADVRYVNGGSVAANIAGGFAGDFQSGTVDDSTKTTAGADGNTVADPWAVINIDTVTGGKYAGGFGGKVHSGALADAGKGVSVLGGLGLNISASDLASVASVYVPVITSAGVHTDGSTVETTSGLKTSDPDDPGLKVTATTWDDTDTQAGSAGGFIGYGSGVQVSRSNVTQLRRTDVKAPSDLETTGSIDSTYLNAAKSSYAVTGARYAGGYIGRMDVGSAASVGGGLKVLGQSVNVGDLLSVLGVVVSTIEHSDVTGGVGGYSVLASTADHKSGGEDDPLGMAGGFAGSITGGHIQDSNAHEFVYIIGQVSAGGYAGTIEPGDVAHVLDDGSVLNKLADISNLVSVAQDFVPTIRNSSTDAVICGGAVRAQGVSGTVRRGMAGGYVGHNSGGHIWGNNTASWKSENTDGKYNGTQRVAYAARIRSVYGQEIAGGYSGLMESADTAEGGSLSLLYGVIKVGNLASVLTMVYPTEEHTKVTGPLRNVAYSQWETWRDNVGKYGAYGKEFTDVVTSGGAKDVTDQTLNAFLADYVFGFNVVAGRASYDKTMTTRIDSGVAGGHVGLMRTGTITDGQSVDVRDVTAMRAAGGYAGTMESGTAAKFGSVELFGKGSLFGETLASVNLGELLGVAQVFVPVVKSSSVVGYRKGMKVAATGVGVTTGVGNAGGYVGMGVGAQIWGDRDANGDELDLKADPDAYKKAAGANVDNLRKVSGTNNVGGYIGIATSGAVADVNTDGIGGFLHKITDQVLTPGKLVSVLDATVVTIRGAHVTPDSSEWGYTVEGAYQDGGTTRYALNAGGFAGSLQAAILGDRKSAKGTGTAVDTAADPAAVTASGLRGVEGGQYAGGFFGLADISSVASVAGGEAAADQSTNLVLKLVKAGNISVLDAFRTFIYDGRVDGVADGIQVRAHDSTTQGTLDSTRFTGSAGGFGGGLINGSVKKSSVTNLNSVSGLNYTGGFIGHLGKAGTVDVDNIGVAQQYLVKLTAGVLDIWGAHVEDSSVAGIPAGFTVTATHDGKDYGRDESLTDSTNRKGEEIAAGFAGYADLSRISGSTVTNFKKASSGELAGGFVGQTTKAYLVDSGVNSEVLNLIIKYLINPLLDILYLPEAENIGNKLDDYKETYFSALTKYLDLELFTDGNALYVNLLGLKIGVALDKHGTENDDTDDTAEIFIGDSSITVGCSKKGVNDGSVDNVHAQLIKANRTKIASSSVEGIADGYDVFGGGATQTSDGAEGVKTGYAGGFAAVNDEGLLEKNTMTYADTIRGTSGLVGPFTGKTNLKSVYSFNSVYGIEGNGNTYRIYRDVPSSWSYALTKDREQFTYGSHLDNETYSEHGVDMTGAHKLTLNRYIVAHLAKSGGNGDKEPAIKQFSDYEGAVMSNNESGSNSGQNASGANRSESLGVYVSAAKAVLMLDKAVSDNNGGVTPEPDDGQDPCGKDGCKTVDLTLQKVWRNGQLERPDKITLQVTATYTDAHGKQQTAEKLECFKDDCTTEKRDNPFTVTMTAKNNGSAWSDTWRTKLTGLPVAFVDKGSGPNGEDVTRYYTYTVKELDMTFASGGADGKDVTKTPAEAGYSVSVKYGKDKDGKYVATVTNFSPLPETGGNGTLLFVMLGVLMLALGTAWYLRANRTEPATAGGAGTSLPFGGKRGRHTR
ncbi:LPXTG cell wall anchor domain protein [Bifidobacterium stellenboschense]|uniref:LPXTG cell wall anchor domain protein n=1 Tax=Bifidobacterium stellenboschense TaxID=762211 RepID=A0A087DNR4_9BIFI|nr:LPXTG cell wall anchor domain protein [Bifidobacterium stellenboschense]